MSLNEAKRLYNQGQQKLADGDFQGAIAKFKQALHFNPKCYLVLARLGDVMKKLGCYDDAIIYYNQSLVIQPNYHEALHNRGTTFYELGRYEEALASLDKAQQANPKCSIGWRSHGCVLFSLKQYNESIKSFDQALNLNVEDYTAWSSRGAALLETGAYEEALRSSDEALKLKPDNDHSWQIRGLAFHKMEHLDKALGCYNQVLRLRAGDHIIWLNRGNVLLQLKRYDEALEDFNRIVKYEPNDHHAWYSKGSAFAHLNRYEEALVSYEKAVEIQPDCLDALSEQGAVLRELGRYQEALAIYSKVLEREHDHVDTLVRQGVILDDIGRYEDAIASCDKALEFKPDYFRAWLIRGFPLVRLERYEEALESFVQATKLDSHQSTVWDGQGRALRELGQYGEAQKAFERALSIDPDVAQVWLAKGETLHKQNFFSEAITAYEQALKLDSQLPFAWINLGNAIWDAQGLESALEKWDEAFYRFQPDSPKYAEACGNLYRCKGFALYQEGRKRENYFAYWRKAASFYQMALRSFEQLNLQEDYLETLKSLVQVFIGLGRTEEVDVLLNEGTNRLQRLLDEEITPSPGRRKILALKFAGFEQLTVDRQIQAANQLKDDADIKTKLKEALETAERGKNACLSWLLYALSDEVARPSYEEMQQLLSPGTAIAYWHLSPAALTTFVLKPGESAPILITQPSTSDHPESLQRLLKLEAWMKEWDDQYQDYRNQGKDQRNTEHSWRKDMAQRLFERQEEPCNLKEILNIAAIEQHLDGINHLILVPHRDLHRFPLHALFDPCFTVSYLPSIQVGLNLKGRQPSNVSYLLSVENPESNLGFARVESQIISQTFQQVNFIREAEATQKTVMDALKEGCNVLHFSGHAGHDSENPQRSELSLAGDDRLTLQEICQHDLTRYDLVSLSACETALTNNQSITTEYVGLISGFLYSGVAQVISTLWVVESAASALVMIEFYRRRSDKSDAIALAEAIQWLRGLTRKSFETWCIERLTELPLDLSHERRSKIKRTLETTLLQWNTIEEDNQNAYSWSPFILSGGFF